jgi:hypothetical protein
MKQVTLSVADGKIKILHADLRDEFVLDPDQMKKCLEELGLRSEAFAAASLSPANHSLPAGAADLAPSLLSPASAAASHCISMAQASALLSETEARGKAIPAEEFFRGQVERELDEAIKSGKILPRQRGAWRKVALTDFSSFREILAEQKPQLPLRPLGFSGTPPEDVPTQVRLLAEQRSRERQISFGQALTEIGREHPDLVTEYRKAVSRS